MSANEIWTIVGTVASVLGFFVSAVPDASGQQGS
jgi:hypothetical protein